MVSNGSMNVPLVFYMCQTERTWQQRDPNKNAKGYIFKNDALMENPRPSKEDENANAQNASVNDDGVQRC